MHPPYTPIYQEWNSTEYTTLQVEKLREYMIKQRENGTSQITIHSLCNRVKKKSQFEGIKSLHRTLMCIIALELTDLVTYTTRPIIITFKEDTK